MKRLNLKVGDRIRLKSFPKHWTNIIWVDAVGKEWEVVSIIHEDCIILKCCSELKRLYMVNHKPENFPFRSKDLEYFELVNDYGGWPCWL